MTFVSNIFRENIRSLLKEQRPGLSESSLKTYTSVLFNLYKHMQQEGTDADWYYNDYKNILEFLLETTKKSSRKTILSALYVLTNRPEYHELMIADAKDINQEYKNQKKSDKQEKNWISVGKIKEKYQELHETVQRIFKKKVIADMKDIVDYLLVGFLSGILMPPRRSLDYSLLKWKDYDKKTDNYYSRGKLYFNKYKTSDVYGLSVMNVPKELDIILKKWTKINPCEYVLINSNHKPLSSSQITRKLNNIFGNKVSVNMLRHIFLSHYYKDTPKVTDMEEMATNMGHSVSTALRQYVKKD